MLGELADADRRDRDPVLVGLDLGGDTNNHLTSSLARSASQSSIRSVARLEVAAGELLDLADPVAQRVAVAVELAGRALPVAVVLDERLQRAQQLAAVLALGALDRLQEAVAVEAQRVVVLEREQQGEGAEVAVRGDVGGVAVGERGRLERAAGLVEGAAQRADAGGAAGRGADPVAAGAAGERRARAARGADRLGGGRVDDRAEQRPAGGGAGRDQRRDARRRRAPTRAWPPRPAGPRARRPAPRPRRRSRTGAAAR